MPILPSLRDRALCVQANAPGIRVVKPEARAQQAFSAGTKKPLSGLFCSGGEGGIRTRGRLLTYARFPGV